MPEPIQIPSLPMSIRVEPLTESLFSDFGTVIENPSGTASHGRHSNAVSANQNTALKYIDISRITNFYGSAPSRVEAKAVMNMFVCSARDLGRDMISDAAGLEGVFPVRILERHPFTSQSFIPMGLSKKEMEDTRYLVIVAPSLPPSPLDDSLPVPIAGVGLPGRGMPDLRHIRAFMAHGSQGISYGAGTWHAPMVVLSKTKKTVDFVVVQYANGVDIEDCQEAVLQAEKGSELVVMIQQSPNRGLWRL